MKSLLRILFLLPLLFFYQNCGSSFEAGLSQSESLSLQGSPGSSPDNQSNKENNQSSPDTNNVPLSPTGAPEILDIQVNAQERSLTVRLKKGVSDEGLVFDYHLGSQPQKDNDNSRSNDLGDSSGVGSQLFYTFPNLPEGDYKVYGRVYYSSDNFANGGSQLVANGQYLDFSTEVNIAPSEPEVPPLLGRYIKVGSNPGDAQCLNLGRNNVSFGSAQLSHWTTWLKKAPRFFIGREFLSVEDNDRYGKVLRHKFVPNFKGTEWVAMGANISGSQTYRLVQSIYFEKGWDWGGERYQGGKLGFGFGSGTYPTGGKDDPKGFTARLGWRGNRDGTANIIVYSYAADRSTEYGEDIEIGPQTAPIGEWIEITIEITTNSSIGKSDGSLRGWINGELRLNKSNIGWQLAGNKPMIDSLFYMGMYGGHGHDWSPDGITYMKLGDVCWSQVVNGYSGIDPDAGITKLNPQDRN